MKTLFIGFLITLMMIGFCVLVWGIITLKDYYSKNHIDFSSSNIEKALKKILQSLNNKIKSSKKS